jgi:hypothetical protein
MLSSFIRWLFCVSDPPPPRSVPLGLDTFEDRVVPASITFTNGVLFVQADQNTNDVVLIAPAGAARDGSTGVRLITNVTGTWTVQTFGDATTPVTNIGLDMKDGNDFVDVASLRATTVLVGEGNGNNTVIIGATLSGALIAGSGTNNVFIRGGSTNVFTDGSLPGVVAGSGAYIGWAYTFQAGGTALFTNGPVGNTNANLIVMPTSPSQTAVVDVMGDGNNLILGGCGALDLNLVGNGNNTIFTGSGNDTIQISGSGNNAVHAGRGNDTVSISGNGNNTVWDHGSGSVTINGSGTNAVHARCSSNLAIALNGAGVGSSVHASTTDTVFVDGTQATASGTVGNVAVTFV